MKWKTIGFGCLTCTALFFFFRYYCYDLYRRQEELQFFIPQWQFFKDTLLLPGGCCSVFGQWITQYYHYPLLALLFNTLLLCCIGYFCHALLQRSAVRDYNYLLALIPVVGLSKMHLSLNYAVAGTIGLCLMMGCLWGYSRVREKRMRLLYGMVSMLAVYLLAGPLALPYTLLLLLYNALHRLGGWKYAWLPVVVAAGLTWLGTCLTLYMPLREGLRPEAFHEAQVRPDSYIYYVWIRFAIVVGILLITGYLLKKILWLQWWRKILATGIALIALIAAVGVCMPDAGNVQNRKIYRLMTLAQQKKWDRIISD